MRRLRGDAGSLAPAVPILAFVLLLLGGLVIDASRQLTARGRAVAYAEEAARAGAGAIRPGQAALELDEAGVEARVEAYCRRILGDVTQSGGVQVCRYDPPLQPVGPDDPRLLVVRVSVGLEVPASLLAIVGVQRLWASGQGRARPFEGVDPRDVDSPPPPVELPRPDQPPGVPPGVDVPVFPEPEPPPILDPLDPLDPLGPIDPGPIDPIAPIFPDGPPPVALPAGPPVGPPSPSRRP